MQTGRGQCVTLEGPFAPFWLIEHRGLSAGGKLCHVRLLGVSLGVSGRQARGYVRELEKAGFIAVEQRGLGR